MSQSECFIQMKLDFIFNKRCRIRYLSQPQNHVVVTYAHAQPFARKQVQYGVRSRVDLVRALGNRWR